ncbi:hypothetical protein Angca_000909, partial [Angiostrongylus cantonensis]
ANQVTNYAVMLSSIIAYLLILFVLKFKREFSRNMKEELILTLQVARPILTYDDFYPHRFRVALSVGIEMMFFLLWEFHINEGAFLTVIAMVSNLSYYNAVTLPYFLMNKLVALQV